MLEYEAHTERVDSLQWANSADLRYKNNLWYRIQKWKLKLNGERIERRSLRFFYCRFNRLHFSPRCSRGLFSLCSAGRGFFLHQLAVSWRRVSKDDSKKRKSLYLFSFLVVFRIRIQLIRIRFQHFRPNTVQIQDYGDQKQKKIAALNTIKHFFDQKLQFTYL